MRTTILAGLAVSALTLWLGCGGGGEDQPKWDWKTYTSDEGFSVSYPYWSESVGWFATEPSPGSVQINRGAGSDVDTVVEISDSEGKSVKEFADAHLAELKKNKNFKITTDLQQGKKSGKEAWRVTYIYTTPENGWNLEGDKKARACVVYVKKGSKILTMRTASRNDRWDKKWDLYFKDMHKKLRVK